MQATLDQYELIEDDPRVDAEKAGPMELLRAWRDAREKHGELISRAFAASLLGVGTGHISVWCSRGRLTDVKIGKITAVALDEILALRDERMNEGLSVGGHGKKMPSMAEVIKLGMSQKAS